MAMELKVISIMSNHGCWELTVESLSPNKLGQHVKDVKAVELYFLNKKPSFH